MKTCVIANILLFLLPLTMTNPVEVASSEDSYYYDSNYVMELYRNGMLDQYITNEELSNSQVQGSDNTGADETFVSEKIIHPYRRSVQNRQVDSAGVEVDLCGVGTECKRRLDNSMSMRREELKKNLLRGLKLSRPPNVKAENMLDEDSPLLREAIERNFDINGNERNSEDTNAQLKTIPLLSIAKKPSWAAEREDFFFFNLTKEKPEGFDVKSAILSFYVIPGNYSGSSLNVNLYSIRRRSRNPRHALLLDEVTLDLTGIPRDGGRLNITYTFFNRTVEGWLNHPETNFGIKLTSEPNIIASGFGEDPKNHRPVLKIEFVEEKTRAKRSVENSNYCSNPHSCCLYNFTIDFHEIGWKFVIYPRVYQANYCSGRCSPIQFSQTVHASLVQSQQNRSHLTWQRPCCVGKEYAPISMLYYDDQENIVYSSVPDMQILRCGCA